MQARTMSEDVSNGTAYRVHIPGWAAPYWPPAADTVQEVVECYRDLVRRGWVPAAPAGTVAEVDLVTGGVIGALRVKPAGTVTL